MLLYGASGHAQVVKDAIQTSGEFVNAIFDDNPDLIKLDDTPVIGLYKSDYESNQKIIISIGDNLIRKKVVSKVKHGFGIAIHASAIVSKYATIDEGTVVLPGAVVNAGASIGKHCIVNTNAVIEHDCELQDYIHISPNVTLCANIFIGEGTHIGAGATIIPGRSIGKWCVIGAGSVITQDIPDFSMVVGVPGKIIRTLIKS